ncbi:MAG: 23S rRNA (adenine(2503)-C(2))-methyltransferase RlmN [Candidatus Paceibacterota bacterium]|jgi:23S rRNA (adenine2503-C2)-methyltransferase
MDLLRFQRIFEKEPRYRLNQAKRAIFQDLISSWSEATVFSLELREKLNKECPIEIFGEVSVSKDKDAERALILLKDGLRIETVLMRHQDRNTICVSSQVGCPLGCSFCATGKIGFKRNLEIGEIIDQVLFWARKIKKDKEKINNIVFMGMGEPFLNYESVIGAIRILNDKDGLNLGARHFSISTVGIIEGIEKLSRESLQINLAISLHAPTDELRSKIMPVNKRYPISDILDAVDSYIKKTNRRVMFEYVMIKGVNNSEKEARGLAKLMKKPLYFVNLISYNPTGDFKPSLASTVKRFKGILEKEGVAVTQRYRFGQDIAGACGQLAGKDSN